MKSPHQPAPTPLSPDDSTRWSRLQQRLAAARQLQEEGLHISGERQQELLEKRARELARELQTGAAAGTYLQYVEFRLADETYGLSTVVVQEVCPLKELLSLPGTPAFISGITLLRGEIVSVVDLRKFFDLPTRGITPVNRLLILRSPGLSFALLTDSVSGIRQIPAASLQTALPTLEGIRQDYLAGITPDRTVILDGSRLLNDPRLVIKAPGGTP